MKIIKASFLIAMVILLVFPYEVLAVELFGMIWYKGKPLQNSEISVAGKKVQTNDKGYYSVDLEPGSYTLSIKLPDGGTKDEKVDVYPQPTEKNLKME